MPVRPPYRVAPPARESAARLVLLHLLGVGAAAGMLRIRGDVGVRRVVDRCRATDVAVLVRADVVPVLVRLAGVGQDELLDRGQRVAPVA